MATTNPLNHKGTVIRAAGELLILAGQRYTEPNGHTLTVEQELSNEVAEGLADVANALRARFNYEPQPLVSRARRAEDAKPNGDNW
jgi:hypothetical protein